MSIVVAVVGPTAVGKSRLGALLARTFNGEVVSADSRQVYRYMDIGTAKPTAAERAAVPHHLIDVVDPDADFSVALYQSLAMEAIRDIMRRHRVPIVVGGSGLYVWSLVEGWEIPRVRPDAEFRKRLEEKAAAEGAEALYRELESVDRAEAASIDPRNVRRVIRALEIHHSGGAGKNHTRGKVPPPFETLILGLTADRRRLYEMIDRRVDGMIEAGLVEEVNGLLRRGYGPALPSMSSVGYREICQFISGRMDLTTAVQRMKFETHRFARQQYAWFRLDDRRIHWFDIEDDLEDRVLKMAEESLK
ncbi:MAG: tRNA (adenosine(37)-N6)-dimethylallyltransferase MiaA [Dehalococcoidia bacterium]|nr:tRNA (adenosine(37)-N6)-dimethylallyltransferase MiaA [Dehalococcoidia bacterium]